MYFYERKGLGWYEVFEKSCSVCVLCVVGAVYAGVR